RELALLVLVARLRASGHRDALLLREGAQLFVRLRVVLIHLLRELLHLGARGALLGDLRERDLRHAALGGLLDELAIGVREARLGAVLAAAGRRRHVGALRRRAGRAGCILLRGGR